MKRFDELLEKDIEGYKGEHWALIRQAPAFYRLMTRLLGDSALPRDQWQFVIAAIAYFILPADIIPESIHGPKGFIDDIYLCATVADQVREKTGSDEILVRNWDGDTPIIPLIQEILSREKELVGDVRDSILAHIGRGNAEESGFLG